MLKDLVEDVRVEPGGKAIDNKQPSDRFGPDSAGLTGQISDVFDLLKRDDGPSLSIEEINHYTADAWAGERRG